MTTFTEIFRSRQSPCFSFEFFPPKDPTRVPELEQKMKSLSVFKPDFMTVTYGAGGKTQTFTSELVSYIQNILKVPAVAHLTCIDQSREEINSILDSLSSANIRLILALRGDPRNEPNFTPPEDTISCARDLVSFTRSTHNFSLAVAGYPETHQDAVSPEADINYLKEKVDAGAELIITQLFFDTDYYFSFRERVEKAGIKIPILPGILPVSNYQQLDRFTTMCGTSIPDPIRKDLERLSVNSADVIKYGTEMAIKHSETLIDGGAPGVHLYTLNKENQVSEIIKALKQV